MKRKPQVYYNALWDEILTFEECGCNSTCNVFYIKPSDCKTDAYSLHHGLERGYVILLGDL